jgi:uncharacterized membrane protein YfhO
MGKEQLELSMVLLIIIKSSCISMSAMYFFRHTNKKKDNEYGNILNIIIDVAFSLAFGLCGYVLAYGHNIMWLDGLILLPIIAIAIERFSSKAGWKMYVICLSIAFVVNFYFAFYICIFAAVYFLLENRDTIKEFFKTGIAFAGATCLSCMISAIVLLPATYVVMNSASSASSLSIEGLNMWGQSGEYISSFYPLKEITCMSLFNNNSFCGSMALLLLAVFFFCNGIQSKTRIKYGMAIIFLVLGLNYLPLNYVLHGFAMTHGLGNRFAFILTFLILVAAYMLIMNLRDVKMWNVIAGLMVVLLIFVVSLIDGRDMSEPLGYVIFMLIIVFISMFFIFWKRNSIKEKTLVYMIMTIWIVEICVNAMYIMPEKSSDTVMADSINLSQWNNTYDNLKTNNGERKTALIGENYGPCSETSWYSSMVNGNIIRGFSVMGMGHYDNVEYVYEGTTPLTAMMYNVRYVMTTETGTLGGYHIVDTNDIYNLYEADDLAGMGFVLDSNISDWQCGDNPFENQNSFVANGFGIQEYLYTEINMTNMDVSYINMEKIKSDIGYCLYKNTSVFSPIIRYEFDVEDDMDLYVYSKDTRAQYVTVTVDGEGVVSGAYYLTENIYHIGEVTKGQHVRISVYSENSSQTGLVGEEYIKIYYFNNELFSQVRDQIINNTLEFVNYDNNRFTGKLTSDKAGILYTAIPYSDGFTIKVDGEVADKIKIGDSYMGVAVSTGEHEITMEYNTPGLKLGILISVIGIILFVLIWLLYKKYTIRNSII